MTRPLAARLKVIAESLRVGMPVTARTISRRLEVSYKTIQRDLDLARDRLDWPLETSNEGWKLTGKLTICQICMRRRK